MIKIHAAPTLQHWKNKLTGHLNQIPELSDLIGYTSSGSSGSAPKCYLFTEEALNSSAISCVHHLHAQQGDWVCPLPLWHLGGAMVVRRAALVHSQAHIFTHSWDPALYAQFIQHHQAAWSSLVPTQVVDIVQAAIPAPSSLRGIVVGGAALDVKVGQQAQDLGWKIAQSFGMTEAASQIATGHPEDPYHTDKLPILPHWDLKRNEQGQLCLRGPARFCTWIETDSEQKFHIHHVNEEDWWQTQDLVTLNNHTLTQIRRQDRNIKILGELVDLDAIEQAFQSKAPGTCIMSLFDTRRGSVLVACGTHPRQDTAIQEWNQSQPRLYHISKSFPIEIQRNTMGKILRKDLETQVLAYNLSHS